MNLRRRHDVDDDDELDPWSHSSWLDGDDDDLDDDLGPARSRLSRIVVVVAAVVAVVGVAFVAARLMRESLHATTAPTTVAVPAATIAVPPSSSAAPPATAAAVEAPTSVVTAPVAVAPVRRPAPIEVNSLQTVPAVRDLVIEINGRRYASAADGSIAIEPADRHGVATVIGVRAQPALLQATFMSWADGVATPTRSLDAVDGPVAQLAFSVGFRVLVTAGIATEGSVTFDSVAGPVAVPIGIPTFVAAARATPNDASMAIEPIVYTVRSIERGGASAPLTAASFTPSPEALWRILP